MRKRTILTALTIPAVSFPLMMAGTAGAHGWVTSPPSRAAYCAQGTVTNCGEIQWEPQSVEGPKGFPAGGPADGRLCAGGNSRFAPLDDPRGGAWPSTPVSSGSSKTFTWKLTARHATTTFRYFVTKASWNPSQPITRAQLESTPFLSVPYGGVQPGATVSHTGTLPAGRSGKAVIFAVWDIADTGNAFYQCTDVTF
ncbi:lytic polysaccharide monooxygenase (plasmid) [Embleya sp. NBC_00888]|uniref:lytic polysaccharide monooxygenase auxiliary activity family 9 protein n=1 Tax=Embleya sp. NBC_00888 TaxID=2975960 RepID=UPI002F9118BC|nr:lytic polysaccharide monooxygenase [Embleya sp. NBC_00888]